MTTPLSLPEPLDPDGLWQPTLSALREQMTRATFNAWLVDSRVLPAACTATFLVVVVRNEYAAGWLTHRLTPMVADTLTRLAGHPLAVCFVPAFRATPVRSTAVPASRTQEPEDIYQPRRNP